MGVARISLFLLATTSIVGCDDLSVFPINENYSLVAVDVDSSMSFCRNIGTGNFVCADPHPVVAAGVSETFATVEVCENRVREFVSLRLARSQFGELREHARVGSREALQEARLASSEYWPAIQTRLERLDRKYCGSEG